MFWPKTSRAEKPWILRGLCDAPMTPWLVGASSEQRIGGIDPRSNEGGTGFKPN